MGCGLHSGRLILTNEATGEESVEVLLEHSKTKHKRWVNAVGTSEGLARVPLAQSLRDYWSEAGFELLDPWRYNGYVIEGVNYFVLRVSLVGLGATKAEAQGRLDLLWELLSKSKSADVRYHAKVSAIKGAARAKLQHSMHERYINVVGGPSGAKCFDVLMYELTKAGFGEQCQIVPGPLIRATHDKGGFETHMPLKPQSSYDALHRAFDEAYRLSNEYSPDPELDLQGLEKPRWGHHSNRRLGDTVARQTMQQTGATERDIDLVFGWNEAFYSQKMQTHYESVFDRDRRKNVTKMI